MRIPRSVPRLATLVAAAVMAMGAGGEPWHLSTEGRRALDAVAADSLRGHLSFLAADALGGRVNGTPGLDVAAEYVAAQLRRAGLEPIGDDGYFQTAPAVVALPTASGFRFSVSTPDGTVKILPGRSPEPDSIAGRVVLTEFEEPPPGPDRREAYVARQRWTREVLAARPALVVAVDRGLGAPTGYFDVPMLVEPRSSTRPPGRVVTTPSPGLARLYAALPESRPTGRLTLTVADPRRQSVSLRNVA